MRLFFRWSLTFLLLLATVMECIQIVLRYFFEMPAIWLDETIIFPAIWLYMLGCANASREDSQIAARITPVFFHAPKPLAVLDFTARLFSAVIACWLAWHAVEYFFYSISVNRKTGYLFWPLAIGESAVGAGMLLVAFYTLAHFAKSAVNMLRVVRSGKVACRSILL